MSNLFNVFDVAGSAMNAQSHRLNVVSSNLANADSMTTSTGEPYRARQVVFTVAPVAGGEAQGVRVASVIEDPSPFKVTYDPKSPFANEQGYVNSPNVNVVDEMVNMISASRSYQNSVDVMNTAKSMLLKTLTIGS